MNSESKDLSENLYFCIKCDKSFCTEKELNLHDKREHQVFKQNPKKEYDKVKCEICTKLISKPLIKSHMNKHERILNVTFNCNDCDSKFNLQHRLNSHIKRMHTIRDPLLCESCNKPLKDKRSLQQHINAVHLRLRPFKCQLCEKAFTDSTPLRNHMQTHTADANDKKYICSVCDKNFLLERHLKGHMNIAHNAAELIVCHLCNSSYNSKFNLKRHMNDVHGQMKFECNECDLKFRNKGYLKKHMLIHSE